MSAVFQPFVQTTSEEGLASTQHREGTGLGLTISRRYARLLGGDIRSSSELGKGSIFTVQVPIELADASSVQPAQPTRWVVGLEPGQPTYRLLIVDDEEGNRKLLVELLQPIGFELQEAVHGQEAIERWRDWQPHAILMDMRMPVLDGYEATKQIKAAPRGQDTVILALTASVLVEDRAAILAAGCDGFIRKPLREEDLFDALAQHLNARFVHQEAQEGEPGAPELPEDADARVIQGLAALSRDLVSELRQATVLADLALIMRLIDRTRQQDTSLADALTDLAHSFEHDKILRLIQQAGG